MTLNQFAAERRLAILDRLVNGLEPQDGLFDPSVFLDAQSKGTPQMGTTRYLPDEIAFEFIYTGPQNIASILTVITPSPERIVYLPVPSWVVENVWQGEVAGAFHFESDAYRLLREFEAELTSASNRKWFDKQAAKRRE